MRVALATTLASTLLVTACAGGDPEATDPGPTSTSAATAAPTSAATSTDGAPTTNLTDGCVEDFDATVDYFPEKVSFDAAGGVRVTYDGNVKIVEVDVPFSEEGAPPFTAVLVQCGTPAPELTGDLADAVVVEVPVEDVVSLTTVNLPHFEALGALEHLAGVGTAAYVTTPAVLDEIAAREVPDFADASGGADRERIIGASPGLLIVDAFGATLLDDVRGFASAGVPTVINADFNETTPLGRAEWVKYTSLFLNREAAAQDTFDEVSAAYAAIADEVADVEERPTVLLEQPYEGTWYAPTGGSFVGQLVADAGGDYVFADEPGAGSLSLDIETVLAEAGDADLWIGAGSVHGDLEALAGIDARFREFDAFEAGRVWALDAGTNEAGGNPLYERAVMRPDLQLGDLAAILHPDRFPDHEFVFYGPVPATAG